ncbi:PIN domain-containing protein [Phormidesmis priestleyi ULC007]|uniref:PIN domain-containing protein n=1 Tax=Phormidesmis priestleyi ULC007 TaxID=1920490 RepID=A0A2T1DI99_9CYAN|nr:type II toxin-antitoxin system VapC family toxin [Phormidesmis priestleyi]PSB20207.1 PIN domain-containing protein [Phormidesmis priestleyi ULC007]
MAIPLHYWDSCTFLGYLKAEADKVDGCVSVLKHAEKGSVKIVTSSLSLVEVIKLKKREPISREDEEKIRRFFMHKWIVLQDVDRKISELARELVWEHVLRPYDAVHVATAIRAKVNHIDTFDDDLIKLSEKLGEPKITMGKPFLSTQTELEFPS